MTPDRFLSNSRIIELTSAGLEGALRELLTVALRGVKELELETVLKTVMEQENIMGTCLGNGVAMPHARLPMKRRYLMAIGRAKNGLDFNGVSEYKDVRFVFLLLASDAEAGYLNMLAKLARLFGEKALIDHMVAAPSIAEFRNRVLKGFGSEATRPDRRQRRFNQRIYKEAERLAKAAKASTILLFADSFAGGVDPADGLPDFRTILITRNAGKSFAEGKNALTTIEVRSLSNQRLSQMRSAILIGLTGGVFKPKDKLVCVGGLPNSNLLDTLIVVDVAREFQGVITKEGNLLPAGVKIEVFERMLGIATDIAVEGREGKPVGALFVIGDADRVNAMVKPLVLNPFYGYKEEDRNALNPFMDETIKEFSVIDGCFVIRGSGVIESAGSLIHAPTQFYHNLPSGLGSRHAAAAAISHAADCLAIVVSASTGQVTLFRRGVMMPLLEAPLGGRRLVRG